MVFPSSEVATTGESSTRSICDSGTREGVEMTSRGAADAASAETINVVMTERWIFMKKSNGTNRIPTRNPNDGNSIYFAGATLAGQACGIAF